MQIGYLGIIIGIISFFGGVFYWRKHYNGLPTTNDEQGPSTKH